MDVLECQCAEDAISILDLNDNAVCFLFTDVKLAGAMSGAALAVEVDRRFPNIDIVVTSGAFPVEHLPANAKFISKPWRALDILNAAQCDHRCCPGVSGSSVLPRSKSVTSHVQSSLLRRDAPPRHVY